MSLKLIVGKSEVRLSTGNFPAGEAMLRIEDDISRNFALIDGKLPICIHFKYTRDDGLFALALLVDAVRRLYPYQLELSLVMNYLPYARQDRVCNKGESLSVKVVADFINSLKFDRVFCKDIHSDVGVALIDNLIHIDQVNCAATLPYYLNSNTVVVSPDAGASKKAFTFANSNGYDIVRADKIRNVSTGQIVETKVYSEHIGSRDFLILDDLCDAGGTFIALAKELRKLTDGKIYLYVTHGLFTKGAEVFEGVVDGIFVSNLMGKTHPLVKETDW